MSRGIALITGASTGIGAVYADRLAKQGYDLILVARDAAKLQQHAQRITSETGRTVETVAADLVNKSDLARVEDILRSNQKITVLVNNAGLGATSKLIDSPVDEMEHMITLNVTALTRLTQAVLPGFVERKQGTLINIASIVAVAPDLLNGVYGGTKAFVLALTQSLSNELKDKGIRIQAVLPGAIDTPFWDRLKYPVHNLPAGMVMTPENLVDAALKGLELGELITIPSLPDVADWEKADSARKALAPNLSKQLPAARYGINA
ncbi:MAG: SDR family oxidoreductase [Acidobacteriaceae bacterium]|nr:SDR family oxidoreductase [Acidobacteriaceae bacterium]